MHGFLNRQRFTARQNQVTLVGFGTSSVRERAVRSGRNPITGETRFIMRSMISAFKTRRALIKGCELRLAAVRLISRLKGSLH
ncbi:MAG: HU family DNA-binding protein [gamma proteobacterium endosymbiont of Lamellibrachia anaximandri]|nr:HU family DNA-binding protein [gamma proteobacterium endosymbiont of Lamellibrachia anaximandri]MBL3618233.1 HU family DNA-binding protein [gamma proteobacterium endosymbiont of Lamellibrachia anaximandri]